MASKKKVKRPSTPISLPKKPEQKAGGLSSSPLLNLQQSAGNRAVGAMLQKKALDGQTESDPAETSAAPSLIVEDDTAETAPGQMRKSEFLAALQPAVCSAADEALASTGRDTDGCPYIERWFNYYRGKDGRHLEQAIHKYAPETRRATAARQYIPVLVARVRQGVKKWATTGEIGDVPEELVAALSGGGLLGGLAALTSGMGRTAIGLMSGIGQGLSTLGQALFKRRGGTAGAAGNPAGIQAQLNNGRPIEGGVRTRMENAFGTSFSNVKVHTGTQAAGLSDRLDARAFTVGQDVAFGAGEYRPGTPIGDALLAHELAHVVQQKNGRTGGAREHLLEDEADETAVHAVAGLWGVKRPELAEIGRQAMPRLRSGLRLQRCKSEHEKEVERLAGLQRSHLEAKARENERKRLEKERAEKIKKLKESGVKKPEVPPVKESDIQITDKSIKETINEDIRRTTSKDKSIQKWLDVPDKGKYISEARKTIEDVIATAKSKPEYADIAALLDKVKPEFSAETAKTALKKGWYASASGSRLKVSMGWIEDARKDPKLVFANIAHEIGGHIFYGDTLSNEVSDKVLKTLDPKVRKSLTGTKEKRQKYHDTYIYQETELFSELRERRYYQTFKPTKRGGDNPDTNIPELVQQLKDNWHPEVAKVILERVIRRAKKTPEIREEDINFLMGLEVTKSVLGSGAK